MSLKKYSQKRQVYKSREPKAVRSSSKQGRIFVIQKHHASTLHYDFRLEFNGVLKSWAVPKGFSKKTADRRLAIQTEDHPLSYAQFEGTIPKGNYGAGKVALWDNGQYLNVKLDDEGNLVAFSKCLREGYIEVYLFGQRYKGPYAIFRTKNKNWLVVKMHEDRLLKRLPKCIINQIMDLRGK